MARDAPRGIYPLNHFKIEATAFQTVSEGTNDCEAGAISLDNVLPDDILERILSFLPTASILRAKSVCKRWYDIVHSRSYLWAVVGLPQKPWYFMFTSSEAAVGYAYDPVLRKWYNLELPCIEQSNWSVSTSCGLVCVVDNDSRSRVFVCNPITKDWKRLIEPPPGTRFPDYSALSIYVDNENHGYVVAMATSKQVCGDYQQWDLSIHVYESVSELWVTSINDVLNGWRVGDESVICSGVLYCLIHSTGVLGSTEFRYGLIVYNLRTRSPRTKLIQTFIPAPCHLTCGRLMNLKDKVVMVGGIAKPDRPDIIKGIGIWELNKKDWREIARMPHKFFQGFGELDDVFASSGSDDLVYIQSYGNTTLLVFDVKLKRWKWSAKCPVSKRFPLQLFSGFCFEPRIETAS